MLTLWFVLTFFTATVSPFAPVDKNPVPPPARIEYKVPPNVFGSCVENYPKCKIKS